MATQGQRTTLRRDLSFQQFKDRQVTQPMFRYGNDFNVVVSNFTGFFGVSGCYYTSEKAGPGTNVTRHWKLNANENYNSGTGLGVPSFDSNTTQYLNTGFAFDPNQDFSGVCYIGSSTEMVSMFPAVGHLDDLDPADNNYEAYEYPHLYGLNMTYPSVASGKGASSRPDGQVTFPYYAPADYAYPGHRFKVVGLGSQLFAQHYPSQAPRRVTDSELASSNAADWWAAGNSWRGRWIKNIQSVIVPDTVFDIKYEAFRNGPFFTIKLPINNDFKMIQDGTFADCSNLNAIYIPKSVTTICNEAFVRCNRITQITVEGEPEITMTSFYNSCSPGSVSIVSSKKWKDTYLNTRFFKHYNPDLWSWSPVLDVGTVSGYYGFGPSPDNHKDPIINFDASLVGQRGVQVSPQRVFFKMSVNPTNTNSYAPTAANESGGYKLDTNQWGPRRAAEYLDNFKIYKIIVGPDDKIYAGGSCVVNLAGTTGIFPSTGSEAFFNTGKYQMACVLRFKPNGQLDTGLDPSGYIERRPSIWSSPARTERLADEGGVQQTSAANPTTILGKNPPVDANRWQISPYTPGVYLVSVPCHTQTFVEDMVFDTDPRYQKKGHVNARGIERNPNGDLYIVGNGVFTWTDCNNATGTTSTLSYPFNANTNTKLNAKHVYDSTNESYLTSFFVHKVNIYQTSDRTTNAMGPPGRCPAHVQYGNSYLLDSASQYDPAQSTAYNHNCFPHWSLTGGYGGMVSLNNNGIMDTSAHSFQPMNTIGTKPGGTSDIWADYCRPFVNTTDGGDTRVVATGNRLTTRVNVTSFNPVFLAKGAEVKTWGTNANGGAGEVTYHYGGCQQAFVFNFWQKPENLIMQLYNNQKSGGETNNLRKNSNVGGYELATRPKNDIMYSPYVAAWDVEIDYSDPDSTPGHRQIIISGVKKGPASTARTAWDWKLGSYKLPTAGGTTTNSGTNGSIRPFTRSCSMQLHNDPMTQVHLDISNVYSRKAYDYVFVGKINKFGTSWKNSYQPGMGDGSVLTKGVTPNYLSIGERTTGSTNTSDGASQALAHQKEPGESAEQSGAERKDWTCLKIAPETDMFNGQVRNKIVMACTLTSIHVSKDGGKTFMDLTPNWKRDAKVWAESGTGAWKVGTAIEYNALNITDCAVSEGGKTMVVVYGKHKSSKNKWLEPENDLDDIFKFPRPSTWETGGSKDKLFYLRGAAWSHDYGMTWKWPRSNNTVSTLAGGTAMPEDDNFRLFNNYNGVPPTSTSNNGIANTAGNTLSELNLVANYSLFSIGAIRRRREMTGSNAGKIMNVNRSNYYTTFTNADAGSAFSNSYNNIVAPEYTDYLSQTSNNQTAGYTSNYQYSIGNHEHLSSCSVSADGKRICICFPTVKYNSLGNDMFDKNMTDDTAGQFASMSEMLNGLSPYGGLAYEGDYKTRGVIYKDWQGMENAGTGYVIMSIDGGHNFKQVMRGWTSQPDNRNIKVTNSAGTTSTVSFGGRQDGGVQFTGAFFDFTNHIPDKSTIAGDVGDVFVDYTYGSQNSSVQTYDGDQILLGARVFTHKSYTQNEGSRNLSAERHGSLFASSKMVMSEDGQKIWIVSRTSNHGIFRSLNGGATWQRIYVPGALAHGDPNSTWFSKLYSESPTMTGTSGMTGQDQAGYRARPLKYDIGNEDYVTNTNNLVAYAHTMMKNNGTENTAANASPSSAQSRNQGLAKDFTVQTIGHNITVTSAGAADPNGWGSIYAPLYGWDERESMGYAHNVVSFLEDTGIRHKTPLRLPGEAAQSYRSDNSINTYYTNGTNAEKRYPVPSGGNPTQEYVSGAGNTQSGVKYGLINLDISFRYRQNSSLPSTGAENLYMYNPISRNGGGSLAYKNDPQVIKFSLQTPNPAITQLVNTGLVGTLDASLTADATNGTLRGGGRGFKVWKKNGSNDFASGWSPGGSSNVNIALDTWDQYRKQDVANGTSFSDTARQNAGGRAYHNHIHEMHPGNRTHYVHWQFNQGCDLNLEHRKSYIFTKWMDITMAPGNPDVIALCSTDGPNSHQIEEPLRFMFPVYHDIGPSNTRKANIATIDDGQTNTRNDPFAEKLMDSEGDVFNVNGDTTTPRPYAQNIIGNTGTNSGVSEVSVWSCLSGGLTAPFVTGKLTPDKAYHRYRTDFGHVKMVNLNMRGTIVYCTNGTLPASTTYNYDFDGPTWRMTQSTGVNLAKGGDTIASTDQQVGLDYTDYAATNAVSRGKQQSHFMQYQNVLKWLNNGLYSYQNYYPYNSRANYGNESDVGQSMYRPRPSNVTGTYESITNDWPYPRLDRRFQLTRALPRLEHFHTGTPTAGNFAASKVYKTLLNVYGNYYNNPTYNDVGNMRNHTFYENAGLTDRSFRQITDGNWPTSEKQNVYLIDMSTHVYHHGNCNWATMDAKQMGWRMRGETIGDGDTAFYGTTYSYQRPRYNNTTSDANGPPEATTTLAQLNDVRNNSIKSGYGFNGPFYSQSCIPTNGISGGSTGNYLPTVAVTPPESVGAYQNPFPYPCWIGSTGWNPTTDLGGVNFDVRSNGLVPRRYKPVGERVNLKYSVRTNSDGTSGVRDISFANMGWASDVTSFNPTAGKAVSVAPHNNITCYNSIAISVPASNFNGANAPTSTTGTQHLKIAIGAEDRGVIVGSHGSVTGQPVWDKAMDTAMRAPSNDTFMGTNIPLNVDYNPVSIKFSKDGKTFLTCAAKDLSFSVTQSNIWRQFRATDDVGDGLNATAAPTVALLDIEYYANSFPRNAYGANRVLGSATAVKRHPALQTIYSFFLNERFRFGNGRSKYYNGAGYLIGGNDLSLTEPCLQITAYRPHIDLSGRISSAPGDPSGFYRSENPYIFPVGNNYNSLAPIPPNPRHDPNKINSDINQKIALTNTMLSTHRHTVNCMPRFPDPLMRLGFGPNISGGVITTRPIDNDSNGEYIIIKNAPYMAVSKDSDHSILSYLYPRTYMATVCGEKLAQNIFIGYNSQDLSTSKYYSKPMIRSIIFDTSTAAAGVTVDISNFMISPSNNIFPSLTYLEASSQVTWDYNASITVRETDISGFNGLDLSSEYVKNKVKGFGIAGNFNTGPIYKELSYGSGLRGMVATVPGSITRDEYETNTFRALNNSVDFYPNVGTTNPKVAYEFDVSMSTYSLHLAFDNSFAAPGVTPDINELRHSGSIVRVDPFTGIVKTFLYPLKTDVSSYQQTYSRKNLDIVSLTSRTDLSFGHLYKYFDPRKSAAQYETFGSIRDIQVDEKGRVSVVSECQFYPGGSQYKSITGANGVTINIPFLNTAQYQYNKIRSYEQMKGYGETINADPRKFMRNVSNSQLFAPVDGFLTTYDLCGGGAFSESVNSLAIKDVSNFEFVGGYFTNQNTSTGRESWNITNDASGADRRYPRSVMNETLKPQGWIARINTGDDIIPSYEESFDLNLLTQGPITSNTTGRAGSWANDITRNEGQYVYQWNCMPAGNVILPNGDTNGTNNIATNLRPYYTVNNSFGTTLHQQPHIFDGLTELPFLNQHTKLTVKKMTPGSTKRGIRQSAAANTAQNSQANVDPISVATTDSDVARSNYVFKYTAAGVLDSRIINTNDGVMFDTHSDYRDNSGNVLSITGNGPTTVHWRTAKSRGTGNETAVEEDMSIGIIKMDNAPLSRNRHKISEDCKYGYYLGMPGDTWDVSAAYTSSNSKITEDGITWKGTTITGNTEGKDTLNGYNGILGHFGRGLIDIIPEEPGTFAGSKFNATDRNYTKGLTDSPLILPNTNLARAFSFVADQTDQTLQSSGYAFNSSKKRPNGTGKYPSITSNIFSDDGRTPFEKFVSFWDTSGVINMNQTFAFRYRDWEWNTSGGATLDAKYNNATPIFAPDLSMWYTGTCENMNGMFALSNVNPNILGWDTTKVKITSRMFAYNPKFQNGIMTTPANRTDLQTPANQKDVQNSYNFPGIWSWYPGEYSRTKLDLGKVEDMRYMFTNATYFNNDLQFINTSQVKNMKGMFRGSAFYDAHLSVLSALSTINAHDNMIHLDFWDVSNVLDMRNMFDGATDFNSENIRYWFVNPACQLTDMIKGTKLRTVNSVSYNQFWTADTPTLSKFTDLKSEEDLVYHVKSEASGRDIATHWMRNTRQTAGGRQKHNLMKPTQRVIRFSSGPTSGTPWNIGTDCCFNPQVKQIIFDGCGVFQNTILQPDSFSNCPNLQTVILPLVTYNMRETLGTANDPSGNNPAGLPTGGSKMQTKLGLGNAIGAFKDSRNLKTVVLSAYDAAKHTNDNVFGRFDERVDNSYHANATTLYEQREFFTGTGLNDPCANVLIAIPDSHPWGSRDGSGLLALRKTEPEMNHSLLFYRYNPEADMCNGLYNITNPEWSPQRAFFRGYELSEGINVQNAHSGIASLVRPRDIDICLATYEKLIVPNVIGESVFSNVTLNDIEKLNSFVNLNNLGYSYYFTLDSYICFLAGTMITTDQGIVKIENIDKHKHTINKKKIKCVTRTTYSKDKLVCMKKGSLFQNCPSQDTYITHEHKVYVNKEMVEVESLLNGETIFEVNMQNARVFNIALFEEGVMLANNMISETLHPENVMVYLFMLLESEHVSENLKSSAVKTMVDIMRSESVEERRPLVKSLFSIFKTAKKQNTMAPSPPKTFKI